MWKFDPFFIGIWFFDTQNTFYLILKGLKNAFSYSFLEGRAGLLQMIIWWDCMMELGILVVWWKFLFLSSGIVQNLSVYHTLSCLFVWSSPTAKCVLKGDERQESGVGMCGWLTAHWILLSQKPGELLVWASMSRGGGFCPTKTISTEGFCPEELIMGHRQLRHKAPPPHALPLEQCIYGVSTHWEKSDKPGTPRR